jgi:hypothetical protein
MLISFTPRWFMTPALFLQKNKAGPFHGATKQSL